MSSNVDTAALQTPVNISAINGTAESPSPTASGSLTASEDNTIAFAGPVRTLLLHNQSAANVQFALDIAALANSPYIAAGQLVVLDIHVATLHVYPSATLALNAAGGLIMRGWA
jgi:hypothetical protein